MADELIQPGIFEGMTWWNSNNMCMNMNMMQTMNNPSKSSSCFFASPSPPAFCSQMQLGGDTNSILGYGGGLGWSNHQDPICGNYSSSNKAVVSRSRATCHGGFYEDDDATTHSTLVGGGNCYNPPLFVSSDMGTSTITTVVAAPDSSVQDWSPQDTLVSNTSSDQATNYYMGNNMDHQYPMLSKVDIINDFGAVQDHHHHQGLISISSPSSSSSPSMNSSGNSEGSTVTMDQNNPPAASTNLIQNLITCNEPTTNINQLQLFNNNMVALKNHHIDNYIGMINTNMPINEIPNSWNNFANNSDNSKSTAAAAALAASLEDIRASLLFSPPASPLPPQPQPPHSSSTFAAAPPPPHLQSSSAQFSRRRQAPNSNSEGNNNSSCATNARDHQILKENNKEKAAPTCNEPPLTKRPRIETPSPLPTFKVRKEKLGDRITALQQLVSPFGKTDTASVLHEAIEYIKFLHEQVNVLSTSYMKNAAPIQNHHRQQGAPPDNNHQDQIDLRSRGLCLVPISSTFPVAHETPADFWTPTFGTSFR